MSYRPDRRTTLMYRLALLGLVAIAPIGRAQSLAQRVASTDGSVQIVFPSRPTACGDGQTFIGNLFGQSRYYSGNSTYTVSGSWTSRPCVHGPARVLATVISGEVTRLRTFVGP